jgi:biopolymer transport protein ExbB/TolQ
MTSTRNLDISNGRLAAMLAVSTLIGLSFYSVLMWWTLSGLKEAVRSADVFQTLLAQDPYQAQGVPGEVPPKKVIDFKAALPKELASRRIRIVEMLQQLKVIDNDTALRLRAAPDTIDASEIRLIANLFEIPDISERAFSTPSRTLELLVDAASVRANSCGSDKEEFRDLQVDRLADAIAQSPGPRLGFWDSGLAKDYVVKAADTLDLDPPIPGKATIDCTAYFQVPPWGRVLSYATFSPPEPISDSQLLEALLTSYRLIDAGGFTWPGQSTANSGKKPDLSEKLAAEAMLRTFFTSLLSEVRADPAVRRAQLWVTVIRGWEQAAMIILAVFVAWLLRIRYRETERELDRLESIIPRIARRSADRDIEAGRRAAAEAISRQTESSPERSRSLVTYLASIARNYASGGPHTERRADEFRAVCDLEARSLFSSGWTIRTALALIPALGFLGTVRGILLALADIDSIVRAGSTFDQAAAVSQIGTSLGLAFATTAVALVLGLIFRVISDYQTAREEALVQDCESTFTPLVDPTLGEQTT